jgi:hypothetical protein
MHSIIALVEDNFPIYNRPIGIKSNDSQFSIEDKQSEYLGKQELIHFCSISIFFLGYLDFPYSISFDNIGKNLIFQYGFSGYANARLFHIDRTFINKYNLTPLFKNLGNLSKHHFLLRTKSI